VYAGKTKDFFARRDRALQHRQDIFKEAAECLVERGGIEALLVLEIVVQQGLVDPGGLRNGGSPRSGNALGRKLRNGMGKDRAATRG
jgi:hypothetical protein